jgi:sodium/proline symporter
MAIQSPDMIRKSRTIAMIWVIITLAAAVSIGVIGKAYMPDLGDGETIYMAMINAMFPDVVAGILLTAILAAIMSTASSQLRPPGTFTPCCLKRVQKARESSG